MAVRMGAGTRHLHLMFSSSGIGKGFEFRVEIYTNDNSGTSKTVSTILIAISLIVGLIVNN